MKILHLTLKKKWFDMIASGEKKQEYREIKPYWSKRLIDKKYDVILFRNGYHKDAPKLLIPLTRIWIGYGKTKWGAPLNKEVFILSLGDL